MGYFFKKNWFFGVNLPYIIPVHTCTIQVGENRNCDGWILVNVAYFSCGIWFFGIGLVLRPIATFWYKKTHIGFGLVLVL